MSQQNHTHQYLKKHVSMLAGNIGERHVKRPKALQRAADYISDQWKGMGYRVESQTYKAKGVQCCNLEVTCIGSENPDEILLLGAHYDSVKGCPGANDNASGIAALLEISRAVLQNQPKHSIRFVAFTNEEPPFFGTEQMGSWVYAHRARDNGDDIRLAIVLETLGYYSDRPGSQLAPFPLSLFSPSKGNFVALISNLRSAKLARQLAQGFRAGTKLPLQQISVPHITPGISWSDHSPFWLNGYRALMMTDTAPYRYPYYHSDKDTPERLDYESFTETTLGIIAAINALDEKGL